MYHTCYSDIPVDSTGYIWNSDGFVLCSAVFNQYSNEMPTTKEAKEHFADSVEKEFNKSEATASVEQGVRTFVTRRIVSSLTEIP